MKILDPADLLRVHRSTRGLDEQQIRRIAQESHVIRAESGQVLQGPGDVVEALTLVVSGHLSLALILPGGEEKTVLCFRPR